VTAGGCRLAIGGLIAKHAPDEADRIKQARLRAQEVTFEKGDLLILDPFCTHAASTFREEVAQATGIPGRYVLFSLVATKASVGTTLSGLPTRNYVAPAAKYTEELRSALPHELRHMLQWQLPLEDEVAMPKL
jgi:hypothetical protein